MNDAFASQIERMADEDQRLRRKLADLNSDVAAADARNTERLREIVDEIGWPTRSKVGERAEHLAWLLVQHADRDLAFQRRCLDIMRREPPNEVCPKHLAYLEDRVLVAEGRLQRYGTQLRLTEHGLDARPIEDPDAVDERRLGVGLEPLADYVERARLPV